MDTGLKGRTALVTGASRNMGRLAALAFAREGANLAICTSRAVKELNEVAAEARALGVKVVAERCDITEDAGVGAFVGRARAELGSVDVVVNLAGYRAERPFLEETHEAWDRTIAVNLTGPFHVCRHVLPHMIERRWGRIINTSGVAPYLGTGAAKAMVKLGIVGFTRGLATEFGQYNITANCIGPGQIERAPDPAVSEKPMRASQPMRRKGTPEEAVSLILYLASEPAGFITGQCYLVNGGAYFQ
jgi:3-oxoacyl-[acyl-carrier protein] reductase